MRFFILCFIIFAATPAFGAQLDFVSPSQEIFVGQQFQVDLFLDPENEAINAVDGKIIFPENLLELKEIRDGNSIISFWIERPKFGSGEILFSGIIPGGYAGARGFLFSVVFQAKSSGNGAVEIRNAKVLLNDGEGTSAPLKISNFNFLISNQIPISKTLISKTDDNEPPEEFRPEIAQSFDIFDGKYFLVFATQDKGSGISHYEITETKYKIQKKWIETENSYVLKDQKLRSYIYVKAVDKAGNERMAVLLPKYPLRWYEIWLIWIIIITAIGCILWKIWKIKNKKLLSF